jgi:hypothetical protein
MWNVSDAWYVPIDFYTADKEDQKPDEYFKKMNLHVDKNDTVTKIKTVRTGADPDLVAIVVK